MNLWKQYPLDRPGSSDLAYAPAGGPAKQWLAGAFLAAIPVIYGILCMLDGHATFFGRDQIVDFTGAAAFWLAMAYIGIGAFIHFHFFWGLSERLWRFSQVGKGVALLVFLPSFFYAIYRGFF
jgi:hypothetical protein